MLSNGRKVTRHYHYHVQFFNFIVIILLNNHTVGAHNLCFLLVIAWPKPKFKAECKFLAIRTKSRFNSMPNKKWFDLKKLCSYIKRFDFKFNC